jgi:hypothetical protein
MRTRTLVALGLNFLLGALAAFQDPPLRLRYPAISADGPTILFCYNSYHPSTHLEDT